MLDHLSTESVVLASGARRVDTSAKQIHVPRLLDDGNTTWLNELEEIPAGDPTGNDLTLTPAKVGALTLISNEAIADSNPQVLDTVGSAMVRAVALEVDRAILVGSGGTVGPDGILNASPALQNAGTVVDYASIVTAGGSISAYGGKPDTVYLHPSDYTSLQLAVGADDRPLIQPDASRGGAATIAGFRVFQTGAVGAGTALIAEAQQVVVAIRSDASVEFSSDSKFELDGTQARVLARVDAGINDARGLATLGA